MDSPCISSNSLPKFIPSVNKKSKKKYMKENPPFIYLYQPMTFEAINSKVNGYHPRPAELYYLKGVTISD